MALGRENGSTELVSLGNEDISQALHECKDSRFESEKFTKFSKVPMWQVTCDGTEKKRLKERDKFQTVDKIRITKYVISFSSHLTHLHCNFDCNYYRGILSYIVN